MLSLLATTSQVGLEEPLYLALSAPLLALLAALYYLARKRLKALEAGLGPSALSRAGKALRATSMLAKVALAVLLAVAASKPYLEVRTVEELKPWDEDVLVSRPALLVILLDVSKSMNYPGPSGPRFSTAVRVVKELLKRVPRSDEVALVAFSATPRLVCRGSGEECLDALKALKAGERYTAIGNALAYATSLARASQQPVAVVLVSDGSNNYGPDPLEVAVALRRERISLIAMQVGGRPGALKEIAEAAGGKAYEAIPSVLEALDEVVGSIYLEAKYEALKLRGAAYVERRVRDYSTASAALWLAIAALAVLSVVDGV